MLMSLDRLFIMRILFSPSVCLTVDSSLTCFHPLKVITSSRMYRRSSVGQLCLRSGCVRFIRRDVRFARCASLCSGFEYIRLDFSSGVGVDLDVDVVEVGDGVLF